MELEIKHERVLVEHTDKKLKEMRVEPTQLQPHISVVSPSSSSSSSSSRIHILEASVESCRQHLRRMVLERGALVRKVACMRRALPRLLAGLFVRAYRRRQMLSALLRVMSQATARIYVYLAREPPVPLDRSACSRPTLARICAELNHQSTHLVMIIDDLRQQQQHIHKPLPPPPSAITLPVTEQQYMFRPRPSIMLRPRAITTTTTTTTTIETPSETIVASPSPIMRFSPRHSSHKSEGNLAWFKPAISPRLYFPASPSNKREALLPLIGHHLPEDTTIQKKE
jgi:hypothetical protein